jgi:AraC-like DNA-binding protein
VGQDIPKLLLNAHFTSVEELALAVRGWDLDFIQLDPGSLSADVLQAGIGPVMLGRYFFTRHFHQRGGSPPGVRTFGLVDPPGATWCGRMTDANTILVFPTSADYESFSFPGFLARTISIAEERLDSVSESLGLPTIEEIAGRGDFAARCDQKLVEWLRSYVEKVCRTVSKSPVLLNRTSLYKELNHELPARLLRTLSHRRETPNALPKRRQQAIHKARTYIEGCDGDVSIEELCRVSGVSWRTLDYAFKEHMGLSPKKYLQAFRLNRVHKELLMLSPTDVKISDVANHWGFWHMGRFASEYRSFFGELPSETTHRRTNSK